MTPWERLWPQAREAVRAGADDVAVTDPAHDIEASRRAARDVAASEPRWPLETVRDVEADGVPCRLYVPEGARPGAVVHLHGGGFVFHDVDVHDNAARRLADRCGIAVLSVDYRRPPEHRFPAAPDDVSTVVGWVCRELSGPRYAHGDSAGANLALVAALRHPGVFSALALTYPFLDPQRAAASYDLEGVGFEPAAADWYWEQYAATPADLTHPDLAPLRSDKLGTLPPTLVTTAEGDPLRDEGEQLARRLAELGVRVTATRYLGQIHGYWRHPDAFDAAEALTSQVAGFLSLYPGSRVPE